MSPNDLIVRANSLSKTYQKDGVEVHALRSLNLSIPFGEFLVIQGPSGSGKTTLLNMIGTIDRPSSGSVIIEGADVSDLTGNALADFRRENIGFVFQLFNLVTSLNAIENVKLPLLPYQRSLDFDLDSRARTLMDGLGLTKRLNHFPEQLSGGEQQRVAIARALINQPKLILADEPTGNLDSGAGKKIVKMLHSLNRKLGVTVVIVTHDLMLAEHADRVLKIQDGSISTNGTLK